jgi:hypothetical protein
MTYGLFSTAGSNVPGESGRQRDWETQASLLLHATMHESEGKTWLTDHESSRTMVGDPGGISVKGSVSGWPAAWRGGRSTVGGSS